MDAFVEALSRPRCDKYVSFYPVFQLVPLIVAFCYLFLSFFLALFYIFFFLRYAGYIVDGSHQLV